MIRTLLLLSTLLTLATACATAQVKKDKDPAINAAREVLVRLMGERAYDIDLSLIPRENGCNVFEYEAKNGELSLKGSSPVAINRGFYDYLKAHQLGQIGWSGTRLDLPKAWPDADAKHVVSPYKYHYYMNVVTYGYSTPYWDWARWEQELDWMAFHGLDMPLALIANEAISTRVWKKMGLTQQEIDDFYTGPAHLPWQRMGNITKIDGPLNDNWHKGQVELMHKVLGRMRELGMKPIVPAFAGFVPKGMKRLHPEIKFFHPAWAGFSADKRTSFLLPDTDLFMNIGKLFVEEWEKEFGKCEYYLADCFNEMDIPAPKDDKAKRYELLAHYGDQVYKSITAGNPDATWVMQGWMFGYQRYIWDAPSLSALVSKIPNDRMILLDLAADYNKYFWRNGMNWDFYKGFFGKEWVYSTIPNMGGKTGFTGRLDYYAEGPIEALESENRGNLVGYGFAPEGIENNEVIYELLADMGWRDQAVNLDQWLTEYNASRYGNCPEEVTEAWNLLRKSCFGSFTDHPRFMWQVRPGKTRRGSIDTSDTFLKAIETFASAADQLKDQPTYEADLLEMAAMYLGIKVEQLFRTAIEAEEQGLTDIRKEAAAKGFKMLEQMDRLLSSHPTLTLNRWVDWARNHGTTLEEKDLYEANAKDLVTIWGSQIHDYSARIWSGLIRDYYIPRWKHYFKTFDTGKGFNFMMWEQSWTRTPGISEIEPFTNPVDAAVRIIKEAGETKIPTLQVEGTSIGGWTPAQVSTDWKTIEWKLPADQLHKLKGIRFVYTRGAHRLEMRNVTIIADGVEVARDDHFGFTGTPSHKNFYRMEVKAGATGNNECLIRAEVKGGGGNDSYGRVELIK